MVNIAEILRYAPRGLKLYSLVHGEVTLKSVDIEQDYYPIDINTFTDFETLTKNGKIYMEFEDAECILFPSKEHKSWYNWQEVLFKVGDVVTCTKDINQKDKTFIITGICGNFITLNNNKNLSYNNTSLLYRYATPDEREQFFNELNLNGYKWNADTKQIEKIEQQNTPKYDCFGCVNTRIKEKQFTIDDLKPFDKVLVRNYDVNTWSMEFFESYKFNHYYCMTDHYNQCIPYNDETSKLLGTKNDCPKKYKTW